ncbi:MAG: DUF2752 domain-containing protein [Acidimicrobiales bacterium]
MALVTNTIDCEHEAVGEPIDGSVAPRFGSFSSGQVRFGAAIVGIFLVLAALSNDDGPVLCPLRRCSGGFCPSCGLTRSGGRLLRGDVAGSWAQHPYLLIAVAQVAAVAALWRFGSASLQGRLSSLARPALAANVGIMAAVWVVRMAGGSIPIPFFS